MAVSAVTETAGAQGVLCCPERLAGQTPEAGMGSRICVDLRDRAAALLWEIDQEVAILEDLPELQS